MAYPSRRAPIYVQVSGAYAIENGAYLRQLLEGCVHLYQHRRGARGDFCEMPKVPEFAPFLAKPLGGVRHFAKANITSVLSCFRLGGAFPGRHFRVCLRLATVLIYGNS